MDATTQIIVLIFSYIYGFFLYYLTKLNIALTKKTSKVYRSIITILFMYNIVIIYIIIIYKINNGNFHPYFFVMLVLGILSSLKLSKTLPKNVKFRSFIEKTKKKCYTKIK